MEVQVVINYLANRGHATSSESTNDQVWLPTYFHRTNLLGVEPYIRALVQVDEHEHLENGLSILPIAR